MDLPPEKSADLDREKADLARRAYAVMAASFSPAPPHLIPSFRTWHYPTAGLHVSWTVFQRRADDPIARRALVRRISWDRDGDFERLELRARRRLKVDLTLRIVEQGLDADKLAERTAEASGLPLPRNLLARPYLADRKREFGIDGFDIDGNDGRPIVRVEWDAPYPEDLTLIAQWAAKLRPWLEKAFA